MRTIFVYGANREGRHGKGAALAAMKYHGARYGTVHLVGDSYGVITKELRPDWPPVTLIEIQVEVDALIETCYNNPDCTFECTPFGTGLAGFTHEQMANCFRQGNFKGNALPPNLILPDVWKELL